MEVLLFLFYLCVSISRYMPANTRNSLNIDFTLAHRLRWWTNNKRTWYFCVWSPHVISNLGSDLPPSESRQPYSCHNLTSTRRRLGAGSTSLTLIQRQVDVVSTSGGIWAPLSQFEHLRLAAEAESGLKTVCFFPALLVTALSASQPPRPVWLSRADCLVRVTACWDLALAFRRTPSRLPYRI